MRRQNLIGVIALAGSAAIFMAATTGCEQKTKPAPGNGNGNASTAAPVKDRAASEDAATDSAAPAVADHDAHDHDDHAGHDHDESHAGHDHGDADVTASDATSPDNLADLSSIGITRRSSGIRPTNERDAAADLIYATVRVKMDIMIAERRELLESGVAPTDPEVQRRETSIRRAISLLEENGESVPPIEPPLPE